MNFLRSTLIVLAIASFALPQSASAATTVRLVEERQGTPSSTLVFRSPLTTPALTLMDTTDGMSLAMRGQNLPVGAELRIINARTKKQETIWAYAPKATAFELRAAMPTRMPKGVYVIRATDASQQMLYAQTASFVVNGRGDINTTYRKSQTATMRIFTPEKYIQRMDTNKKRALKQCREVRREEGTENVICSWNDSIF